MFNKALKRSKVSTKLVNLNPLWHCVSAVVVLFLSTISASCFPIGESKLMKSYYQQAQLESQNVVTFIYHHPYDNLFHIISLPPDAVFAIGEIPHTSKLQKSNPMYIVTHEAVVPCERIETKIVLDYYGPDQHELLEIAEKLGVEPSSKIITAIVYQKLNHESIILPEKQHPLG